MVSLRSSSPSPSSSVSLASLLASSPPAARRAVRAVAPFAPFVVVGGTTHPQRGVHLAANPNRAFARDRRDFRVERVLASRRARRVDRDRFARVAVASAHAPSASFARARVAAAPSPRRRVIAQRPDPRDRTRVGRTVRGVVVFLGGVRV